MADVTVVKTATTPAQAKVWIALLQAAGIPAHADGDSLADEVAVSQRLMNLQGTRVLVPTSSLQRAREVLDAETVDAAELERQALSASASERPVAPRGGGARSGSAVPMLVVGAAAAVFCILWLREVDANAAARNPITAMAPMSDHLVETRRSDGQRLNEYYDRNADGHFERIVAYGNGRQTSVAEDRDRDGRYEVFDEHRGDDVVCRWLDTDADGLMDSGTVTGADGKVLQTLRWVAGRGYELVAEPK
jgi:hypothetical protein